MERKGEWLRDPRVRPTADLVDHNFYADAPNVLWVADITFVPIWTGFLYLAFVMDAFSRRVIGWARHPPANATGVRCDEDGGTQRKPTDVIHYSDQGWQYTSVAFGFRFKEMGVRLSLGSVRDCYDNAMCESFFATLECELLGRRKFKSNSDAGAACLEFIEGWYNPSRWHSALGYSSPINYHRTEAEGPESLSP